jgi:hypothetical protein
MSDNTFSFRWGIDILDSGTTSIPNFILEVYHCVEWVDDEGNEGIGISNTEAMFIIHLASFKYESPKGKARPSLTGTLKERMGYASNQGVINVKDSLVKKGLLKITERPGLPHEYNFEGFSRAAVAARQRRQEEADPSTKLDDHPSTKVDEGRQENLTRRRKEEEKEQEGGASCAAPPAPVLADKAADTRSPTDLPDATTQAEVLFAARTPAPGNGDLQSAEVKLLTSGWNIRVRAVKDAAIYLLDATGWEVPVIQSDRSDWFRTLRDHTETFGTSNLPRLYREAHRRMLEAREQGITYPPRPGALTKTMAAIVDERKRAGITVSAAGKRILEVK